ncbi:MAG: RES family NAD+ phosphorylase [Rhodoplanes sp.]
MSGGRKARDPELLDAVDQFDRALFEGQVWRVVRQARDPLQPFPVGARWDPGTFDVLYTSLDRDCALDEVYFHLSRQPVFPSVPFQIHRIRVRLKKVLRLEGMHLLEPLGINPKSYSALEYAGTQAIGDAAFFLGFDALIVPSARRDALNLVIFTDRLAPADATVEHSEMVDWKAWRRSR